MKDIMFQVQGKDSALSLRTFVNDLQANLNQYWNTHWNGLPFPVVEVAVGRKFIKVITSEAGQRSVYCFLDFEGNIYKSESWKKPAKHIRGSVFDRNHSWGKGLGPFGAAYLR